MNIFRFDVAFYHDSIFNHIKDSLPNNFSIPITKIQGIFVGGEIPVEEVGSVSLALLKESIIVGSSDFGVMDGLVNEVLHLFFIVPAGSTSD